MAMKISPMDIMSVISLVEESESFACVAGRKQDLSGSSSNTSRSVCGSDFDDGK